LSKFVQISCSVILIPPVALENAWGSELARKQLAFRQFVLENKSSLEGIFVLPHCHLKCSTRSYELWVVDLWLLTLGNPGEGRTVVIGRALVRWRAVDTTVKVTLDRCRIASWCRDACSVDNADGQKEEYQAHDRRTTAAVVYETHDVVVHGVWFGLTCCNYPYHVLLSA
jgi:hypothetical protein